MQNITPPEASFAEIGLRTLADGYGHPLMAQSALQITRDAIARWSGGRVSSPARRDIPHISPQSRWLAQAQQDLSTWIERGGFSQTGDAASPAQLSTLQGTVMYSSIASQLCSSAALKADACID